MASDLRAELTGEGNNMSDLPYPDDKGQTHWEGCYRERGHHNCCVVEVEQLRKERRHLEETIATDADVHEFKRSELEAEGAQHLADYHEASSRVDDAANEIVSLRAKAETLRRERDAARAELKAQMGEWAKEGCTLCSPDGPPDGERCAACLRKGR